MLKTEGVAAYEHGRINELLQVDGGHPQQAGGPDLAAEREPSHAVGRGQKWTIDGRLHQEDPNSERRCLAGHIPEGGSHIRIPACQSSVGSGLPARYFLLYQDMLRDCLAEAVQILTPQTTSNSSVSYTARRNPNRHSEEAEERMG